MAWIGESAGRVILRGATLAAAAVDVGAAEPVRAHVDKEDLSTARTIGGDLAG